ncbi:peptidoglycan-binding protein [Streptomyces sp. NPDC051561]|uniref:peptidoglycan-binding protein n=1 Tax=Streptomyces sp. NPDC051561 TaxID=3365658 RepID=UPI00378AA21B
MIEFEEIQPAADCPCAGCVSRRRIRRTGALAVRDGAHPASRGVRRALVLATAASAVLGGGGAAGAMGRFAECEGPHDHSVHHDHSDHDHSAHHAPKRATVAEEKKERKKGRKEREAALRGEGGPSDTPAPQGQAAPLHGKAQVATGSSGAPGPGGVAATPKLKPATRADIVMRAKTWVAAKVPYSMDKYWKDGYRQDCSGYVSMAWGLSGNEWTGSLAEYGVKVPRDQLQPGDILLFHNADDPHDGSHVTIFGGWTDYTHDHYLAYEQTRPTTRKQATPIGYWKNAERYVGYRYKGLIGAVAPQGARGVPAFPGTEHFRPGRSSTYVEQLGRQLVEKGFGAHFKEGPSPRWGEADRRNVEAFQRAQGWRGAEADGYPGPETWRRLFTADEANEGTQR